MKSCGKSKILAKFEEAIRLIDDPGVDDRDFGVVYAALSMALQVRVGELKCCRTRSSNLEKDLEQLAAVINCFQSKINTATKDAMGREVIQAYKLFGYVH